MFKFMWFLSIIWIFFAFLLIMATIFGFFAKYHWFFALFSHFRVQYFFATIIFLLIPEFFEKNIYIFYIQILLLIAFVSNLFLIYPYLKFSKSKNKIKADLKVMFINIYMNNLKLKKITDYIIKIHPDIIGIAEYCTEHQEIMKTLVPFYKNSFGICKYKSGFGFAFFSKYKFKEFYRGGDEHMPFSIFEIFHPKQNFYVGVFHPNPPIGPKRFKKFIKQISELELVAKENIIVMGDFNASPWCYYFRKFLKTTNLKDPRKIFGLNFSWLRFTPFSLPIDHILASKNFKYLNFKIDKHLGSDHRPVIAEISF